jgi:hypothetical protein
MFALCFHQAHAWRARWGISNAPSFPFGRHNPRCVEARIVFGPFPSRTVSFVVGLKFWLTTGVK